MKKIKKIDVAIIGASVAGASAALQLANSGLEVALFDKATFPRRKVCGEGLSIIGIEELKRVGLDYTLYDIQHVPFSGFKFIESKGTSEVKLDPHIHGIGVQRLLLDNLIIETAKEKGVTVYLDTQVTIKQFTEDKFQIYSEEEALEAEYLILATGAYSKLPEQFGIKRRENGSGRSGLSLPMRVNNLKPAQGLSSSVKILVESKFQACATPVSFDCINLSIVCDQSYSNYFQRGKVESLLRQISDRMQIDGEQLEEPLTSANIGRFTRESQKGNVFLIGDAVKQLDPIGGMGMSHALISARVTAKTIASLCCGTVLEKKIASMTHGIRLNSAQRRLVGYTNLSYWSLASETGSRILGDARQGKLAREMLLSMQKSPSLSKNPYYFASRIVIFLAAFL